MKRRHLALCLGALVALAAPAIRAEDERPAAAAHEAAAASGEASRHAEMTGHEGEEDGEGPVIDNWWSWDYGPQKAHKHGPFGFTLINFAIYLGILYRLVGGSFREFMRSRHMEVLRALDEAAAIRKKAGEEMNRVQERLSGLEAEIAGMVKSFHREAEAERARIIAAAEAQAAALHRDAEHQIHGEIERARLELERRTALAAIAAAEMILKGQIQDADHKRLVDEYVGQMEAMSGLPSARSYKAPGAPS